MRHTATNKLLLVVAFWTFMPTSGSSAAIKPAVVCSKVRATNGAIIVFYPISIERSVLRKVAEGPFLSHGTRCVIELPENYTETGEHTDTFHLPTDQGVELILEHKWSWGRGSGIRVRGPADQSAFPPDDRTVSYSLKTISGPAVLLDLTFERKRVIGRKFRIEHAGDTIDPRRPDLQERTYPKEPLEVIKAISRTSSTSDLLALEEHLYKTNKKAVRHLVSRMSDPSPRVRESAAALSRWLPESTSCTVLGELLADSSPRVAREARYSLNIALLQKGREPEDASKRELALQMLTLFVQEICRNPNYDWAATNFRPRRKFLAAKQIAVLWHNIPKIPDVEIDTSQFEANGIEKVYPEERIRCTFLSEEQFKDRVKETWVPAIHFHRMRMSEGYARVALSGLYDKGRHWEMNWVALFRRTDVGWKPIAFPPYNEKYFLGRNFSNMNPLAKRQFGGLTPVDIERYEFGIERIRAIDILASRLIERDNFEFHWAGQSGLDKRYEEHLRSYLEDSNRSVRTTVLLSLGKLGNEDVLPEVIGLCANTPNEDIRTMCMRILRALLLPRIEDTGRVPADVIATEILAAGKLYLEQNKDVRLPDLAGAKADVKVLGSYALLELHWQFQGVILLCYRRDMKWDVVIKIGRWIV